MTEIFDLQNSSTEKLKKLQKKSLEILIYFKKFCDDHDLKFSLCGGTCIGAVRHEGFIPWDDDIDVFMLRGDYEKLKELWPKYANTDKYVYCRTTKEHNYHNIAASIRDKETTFINRHSVNDDIVHGIGIDILPLDGYPTSKIKRIWQVFNTMIFSLFNAQRLPDNQGGLVRKLSKLIFSIIKSPKLKYKLWRFSEKQLVKYPIKEGRYITQLLSGFTFMNLKYPKEIFEEVVYMDFEGHKMPVPAGYDKYLSMAFGDYMSYPPKEDQVAKHDTVYINLDEPYKKYKGIYYCVENEGVNK